MLLQQMADTYYGSTHLRYVYVVKFTFHTPSGVADLYSVGYTYMDPNDVVSDMLDSFYKVRTYFLKAEVLAMDKVMDYASIVSKLKDTIAKSHHTFVGLEFLGSDTLYRSNPMGTYSSLIPDKTDLVYVPFLPMEMTSKDELDYAKSIAIVANVDGYVYRVTNPVR